MLRGLKPLQRFIFFGLLHPGVHTNSQGLAIFILEFDDVMVKTLSRAD